jgi:hypothetical protein
MSIQFYTEAGGGSEKFFYQYTMEESIFTFEVQDSTAQVGVCGS